MSAERNRTTAANRRRFLACAASVLGVAAAPVPKGAIRKVSLNQVYAATDQPGLRHFPQKWEDKATSEWWEEVCKAFDRYGASNAILVCGVGIGGAIRSAHRILCCGGGADTVTEKDSPPVWLIAFLGNANISPTEWTVESVTVEGRQIRFTYRPRDKTKDALALFLHCSYDFWVPLPKLTPDVYSVELYDAEEKVVTFSRRVIIKS